jgi:hypothetical protein
MLAVSERPLWPFRTPINAVPEPHAYGPTADDHDRDDPLPFDAKPGDLQRGGVLTEAGFAEKKAELLRLAQHGLPGEVGPLGTYRVSPPAPCW